MTFVARSTTAPLDVAGLHAAALRRLPRAVAAYVDNGADDERTLDANRAAFARYALRQRVLAGVGEVDLRTEVAGTTLDLPVLLAPVGLAGALHGAGDLAAARAAEAYGTRLVLSTGATHSIEEVAAGTDAGHWFQLYPWGDRAVTGSLVRRAADAGYRALFLTVDVPVVGNRLGERRLGMGVEPRVSLAGAADALRRPRWLASLARHRRITMANLAPPGVKASFDAGVQRMAVNMRPDLSWADLEWLRKRWTGPLFVKGVLDTVDAVRAVEAGADGVVVSNHGGRQLNPARATLDVLPEVVDALAGRAQVLLDGGVRSGSDVAVALALGARAVLVGRPWAWALAADGRAGVEHLLGILGDELRRTLHLAGVSRAADLDAAALVPAAPLRYSS